MAKSSHNDNPSLHAKVSKIVGAKGPDQVCILVENLESGMDYWAPIFGVTGWNIYNYSPDEFETASYRGEPIELSMRIALAGQNPQIELIEPGSSPSIYWEWVEQHGYNLHHLGFVVPSLQQALEYLDDAGIEIVQTAQGHGLDGDGGFAYFEAGGVFLEVLELPKRRRPEDARQA